MVQPSCLDEILRNKKNHNIREINLDYVILDRFLINNDFQVFTIEGENYSKELGMFPELARVFDFAEDGYNWNAMYDYMFDMDEMISSNRVAIIWRNANSVITTSLQDFLETMVFLNDIVRHVQHLPESIWKGRENSIFACVFLLK